MTSSSRDWTESQSSYVIDCAIPGIMGSNVIAVQRFPVPFCIICSCSSSLIRFHSSARCLRVSAVSWVTISLGSNPNKVGVDITPCALTLPIISITWQSFFPGDNLIPRPIICTIKLRDLVGRASRIQSILGISVPSVNIPQLTSTGNSPFLNSWIRLWRSAATY